MTFGLRKFSTFIRWLCMQNKNKSYAFLPSSAFFSINHRHVCLRYSIRSISFKDLGILKKVFWDYANDFIYIWCITVFVDLFKRLLSKSVKHVDVLQQTLAYLLSDSFNKNTKYICPYQEYSKLLIYTYVSWY